MFSKLSKIEFFNENVYQVTGAPEYPKPKILILKAKKKKILHLVTSIQQCIPKIPSLASISNTLYLPTLRSQLSLVQLIWHDEATRETSYRQARDWGCSPEKSSLSLSLSRVQSIWDAFEAHRYSKRHRRVPHPPSGARRD